MGRLPIIDACGGRQEAFRDFKIALSASQSDYVALLLDSEDPISDVERPWQHLAARLNDPMPRPKGVNDEQALLMTTCMETWLVADHPALRKHFRQDRFHFSALPSLVGLESRDRHEVHDSLVKASAECSNGFKKGKRSFELLAIVNPDELEKHLPSFARVKRIPNDKL
jgi:hypothetical protein